MFLLLQHIRRQINRAINAFILCQVQHNSLAHPHYFIVIYFEGLPDSSVFQRERRKNQSNNLNDHKYTFESLLQGKAAKAFVLSDSQQMPPDLACTAFCPFTPPQLVQNLTYTQSCSTLRTMRHDESQHSRGYRTYKQAHTYRTL